MTDDVLKSMHIAAKGMQAQGKRLRVISENIANANSLPTQPGELPYRRKVVVFKNELDRALDAKVVRVKRIRPDKSDFGRRYEPTHPAADAEGYVLVPNVNSLAESTDMLEAQRSYELNLTLIKSSSEMLMKTLRLIQ